MLCKGIDLAGHNTHRVPSSLDGPDLFQRAGGNFFHTPGMVFKPTIRNYVDAFTHKPVLRALINSSIIALLTTLISVAAGSMGAYAAARFRFRGSREIPIIVLFGRMIPSITFVVRISS